MTFRVEQSGKRKKSLRVLLIAALIITHGGCSGNASREAVSSGEDFLLNTYCTITIYDTQKEALIRDAFAYARSLENKLSRTVETSEIWAFNHSAPGEFQLSAQAAEVIEKGLSYGQKSEGLFDITIGSLTELWDFSAVQPVVPDSTAIQEALGHVGYAKVELMYRESSDLYFLAKQDPDIHLDLGGIAKGYIADRTAGFLEQEGVTSAVVNFGGNVVVVGEKPDGSPWVIGVEKPFSGQEEEAIEARELIGTVSIQSGSVVTSGTYERKFYQDGKLYYHILDPNTGYPRQTDVMSVTVTGASSTECDALSTTCLMLGLEKGRALIESTEGYEGIFIAQDGTVSFTPGAGFTAY